jgi:outer membrane protein assembly factor BamB
MAVPFYEKFYLFEFNDNMEFKLLATKEFSAEATPFCDNGRIYVASRNGYLYCLGDSKGSSAKTVKLSYQNEVNKRK